MKSLTFLLLFGVNFIGLSQFNEHLTIDKKRTITVNTITLGLWASSIVGLQSTWYKNMQTNSFHIYNDASNWLQMDKAGHFYTTSKLSLLTSDWYKWSGMQPKKAAIIGAAIGLGYQTTIEILDGFATDWGFSWADMAANTMGAGAFLVQDILWKEQRLIPKFSYYPSPYAAYRPNVLGANFQERLLKDYNGQSYWLSFSPGHFQSLNFIPKWFCLSFGYSVDQKLVGDEENYMGFQAKREFLFSLDVDFSQVKTSKKWFNSIIKQLNYIKIPFPTLSLKNGRIVTYGLYF